jgi:ADP-heptose:LPS heptosyltransferase
VLPADNPSVSVTAREHILIIKHGALGDMVLASGAMKTIRAHHADAHLVLLTTRPYAALLNASGWFDEIWIDTRPKWTDFKESLALVRRLRSRRFAWVYDLQTSSRSSLYYYVLPSPKPYFSGIAAGASYRHNTPERTSLHTIDRQRQQLQVAGIEEVFPPDIGWMRGSGDVSRYGLEAPYALLVTGGSAHRPEKRYPEERYIALAKLLVQGGVTPVLIGGGAEAELLTRIADSVPEARNLCNETSFGEIADLARDATFAVGNDTGPMHIIAATGCPSAVLFSHASNPVLCAPRGEHVRVLQQNDLTTLAPEEVLTALAFG